MHEMALFYVPCYCYFREKILVNRGWVPKKRLSPESRVEGQVIAFNLISSAAFFCEF